MVIRKFPVMLISIVNIKLEVSKKISSIFALTIEVL